MGYLHISTRVSITAPIRDWQAIAQAIPLKNQGQSTIVPPVREDIVFAYQRKLEELRTQQGRRTNASWDYDYALSMDNLTEEQVEVIKEAWGKRA
jgi:hypothetical protein